MINLLINGLPNRIMARLAFIVIFISPVWAISLDHQALNGKRGTWTTHQMDHFFPSWNDMLRNMLVGTPAAGDTDCSAQFQADLHATTWRPYSTVRCLLESFPEYRKSEMAAASVLLGLLPVILSQLGPSTVEQGLLGLRRPILAMLLAAGSPTAVSLRNTEYDEALEKRVGADKRVLSLPVWSTSFILLAQYLVALGAAVNVAILAYQLCIWAVTVFSLGFEGLPALWVSLAVLVHFAGVFALHRKVQVIADGTTLRWVFLDVRRELVLSKFQANWTLKWSTGTERGRLWVWLLYVGTVLHILFGSLVLSGLIFISMVDAVFIALRFFGSACACKAVYAFELAGIQEVTKLDKENEAACLELGRFLHYNSEDDSVSRCSWDEIPIESS
ncbi:hypothetical protein TruAng_011421 [Truncatella angustata]|nr:hypothetical protein TruAng_011421 [Truncatella angustata]